MTQFPDLFTALAAPFEDHEVKVRPAQGGRQLHYITARTGMNRLDSVLGPENWWDEYLPLENSVLCKLTLRLPDGQIITKCDAGGYAGMADSGDDDKSGYSDSFKRACAKFGVARYLYRDGVPSFVREAPPADREPGSDDDAPISTAVAPPAPERRPSQAQPSHTSGGNKYATQNGDGNGDAKKHDGPPRSGKAMFAWTKEMEQRHEVGLLKYLNGWAKLQEFPGRMVDWDAEQVAMGYAEGCRKLQAVQPRRGDDPYEEALAN